MKWLYLKYKMLSWIYFHVSNVFLRFPQNSEWWEFGMGLNYDGYCYHQKAERYR
jgi:hypothetical protein